MTEIMISGAGAASRIGLGARTFVEAVRNRTGIPPDLVFDPRPHLSSHQARRLDRLSQFVLLAASEAYEQARAGEIEPARLAVVVGTSWGCIETSDAYLDGVLEEGTAYSSPLTFADSMDNAPAAHCALALRCHGPSLTVTQREASGEVAVSLAALLLRGGEVDAVIVVAGDGVSPRLRGALEKLARGRIATEAAGAIVLETASGARARGAEVLGALLACAMRTERPVRRSLRSSSRLMEEAAGAALASAGLRATPEGAIAIIQPDEVASVFGWCSSDGILRVLIGLDRISTDHCRASVIAQAARGGTATALVIGRAGDAK